MFSPLLFFSSSYLTLPSLNHTQSHSKLQGPQYLYVVMVVTYRLQQRLRDFHVHKTLARTVRLLIPTSLNSHKLTARFPRSRFGHSAISTDIRPACHKRKRGAEDLEEGLRDGHFKNTKVSKCTDAKPSPMLQRTIQDCVGQSGQHTHVVSKKEG